MDFISPKLYAPYILMFTEMPFGFIHSINIYRVSAWYLAFTEQRNIVQLCTINASVFCEKARPNDTHTVASVGCG